MRAKFTSPAYSSHALHARSGCTGGRSGRGCCPECRSPPDWSRGRPRTSPTPARCCTEAASTPVPATIFYFIDTNRSNAMFSYLAGVASTAATPTPAAAPLLHPGDGEARAAAQPLQVAQPVPGPGPRHGLGSTPRLLQG